jgi:hypothetical protein
MVGRYSQNPEASIELARFLGGTEAQTIQAIDKGDSPALMSVYHDAKVVAANPFLPLIYDVLGHTRPRPVLGAYGQGSAVFQKYIHQALADISPKVALAKIQQELTHCSNRDALQQRNDQSSAWRCTLISQCFVQGTCALGSARRRRMRLSLRLIAILALPVVGCAGRLCCTLPSQAGTHSWLLEWAADPIAGPCPCTHTF